MWNLLPLHCHLNYVNLFQTGLAQGHAPTLLLDRSRLKACTYSDSITSMRWRARDITLRFRSPTSSGAKQLRHSIFIFHSMVVVLERVNLVLLGSAGACQPCTTNESHRIGGNNAGVCTTSHCLAPWSHLKTWWGDRLAECSNVWLSM